MVGSGTSSIRMSCRPWNLAARTLLPLVLGWVVVGAGSAGGRRARPAHLAVDDGGDDDQRTLEEVLPGLAEVEEDGGVEHLDDQPGAEERADERAAPTQQAGPAEHHGGDAAEGVADALRGV